MDDYIDEYFAKIGYSRYVIDADGASTFEVIAGTSELPKNPQTIAFDE